MPPLPIHPPPSVNTFATHRINTAYSFTTPYIAKESKSPMRLDLSASKAAQGSAQAFDYEDGYDMFGGADDDDDMASDMGSVASSKATSGPLALTGLGKATGAFIYVFVFCFCFL